MSRKIHVLLLLIFQVFIVFGQIPSGFRKIHNTTIPVLDLQGDTVSIPFAGGLNNCQFGEIDLNLDEVKDLLVFDRHGNRILTFINTGIFDSISYSYAPEYAARIPVCREWMLLRDYDNDGRTDIFTYTTGGIEVFRNISNSDLLFEQKTHPYLVSNQGSSSTNILVTYADYPSIEDLDGDGDLDILTFWGLGSFVEWHKNLSVENFGNADSLMFEKSSSCWGQFAEGAESNSIFLDTCVSFNKSFLPEGEPKHTGSTLLASDFNGDGLPDLLLGDVDFPNLTYLQNGGESGTARMINYTTGFPEAKPVNLISFPSASMLDLNNDHKKDLLVSPFDPGLIRSATDHSCWLYIQKNGSGIPDFEFVQDDFLQDQMLDFGSGAYPAFADINADGLQDLIVGNYGKLDSSSYSPISGLQCVYISTLTYLKNTGTKNMPVFKVEDEDYLDLSQLQMQSLIPAFGDMDGDGDQDLICGNSKGKFVYLQNTAGAGNPFSFAAFDPAFRLLDVGDFSAPQLIDLNSDDLIDIVSGKRDGRLSWYRNTGPLENPQFILETDSLGAVDVTDINLSYFGYSVPCFLKDKQGRLKLIVGSEFGDLFLYDDIMNNLEGEFTSAGTLDMMKNGWRSSFAAAYLQSDTLLDICTGNFGGGLGLFTGIDVSSLGTEPYMPVSAGRLNISPNPAIESIHLDISRQILENCEIEIIDISGKPVVHLKATLPADISLHGLASGLYLLKCKSGNEFFTAKFVKTQ
ncbi:MAG: VCBS repeat-containing protein [Bacteroidales bacterium]|nr:VCBS repeat-containing protein [Bacteroidales bacterium]